VSYVIIIANCGRSRVASNRNPEPYTANEPSVSRRQRISKNSVHNGGVDALCELKGEGRVEDLQGLMRDLSVHTDETS